MANAIAPTEYRPTAEQLALKAEGLTLAQGESLADFAKRVGWKMDSEEWQTFLRRKRETSSRADSGPVFRQDAGRAEDLGIEELNVHEAQKASFERKMGRPETTVEKEPDAAGEQLAMHQRKSESWKTHRSGVTRNKALSKVQSAHAELTGEAAARALAAEQARDPMDEFNGAVHTSQSSFAARCNRKRSER